MDFNYLNGDNLAILKQSQAKYLVYHQEGSADFIDA